MRLVILAIDQESTNYVYHALSKKFEIAGVIIEDPVSKSALLRHRFKKLGFFQTFGQILFILALKWAQRLCFISERKRRRWNELKSSPELIGDPLPEKKIFRVHNINDPLALRKIQDLNPDLIIINGTRIIKARILRELPMALNIHTGITPQYRGVHGGYWALVNQDPNNCGVTIHQVDPGVDTGQVHAQARIQPGSDDWFLTYPLLQYQKALPLLIQVIENISSGQSLTVDRTGLESKQYYHPSLCEYLLNGFRKKVW